MNVTTRESTRSCGRMQIVACVMSCLIVASAFAEESVRGFDAPATNDRPAIPGILSAPTPLPGDRQWQMYTRNPGTSAAHVSWSHDGRWFAIANGQIVRLFDFQAATPEFKVVLAGHDDTVKSVRFSDKGDRLATASLDGTVRIWNADGRQQFVYRAHEDAVQDVSWHPSGDRLASASADGTVRIWSTEGNTIAVLADHEAPVNAVAWNPDGKILASGCENKTIRYWSDKGEPGPVVDAHVGPVRSLAWNLTGSQLLSCDFGIEASVDGDDDIAHLKIWDTSGQPVESLLINQPLSFVSWSPDGTQAVVGTWRSIKIWKVGERQARSVFSGVLNGIVPVAWRPTGEIIAAGPMMIDLQGTDTSAIPLRNASLNSIGLNADATMLGIGRASQSFDYFTSDGEQRFHSASLSNNRNFGIVCSASWSPDGKTFVPGIRYSQTLQQYDAKGQPVQAAIQMAGDTRALAWSRDGKRIAAGGDMKVVSLCDLETGKVTSIGKQNHGISQVRFTPDQQQVCSAGFDGCVRFWSLDGKSMNVVEVIAAPICGLAWSSDGEIMATGHQDNSIRLWDRKGELLTVVGGHGGHVEIVEFSPDGTLLASGSRDNSLRIWKRDGTPVSVFRGHLGAVFGIQWTPDGREIYSCSEDGTIRRWNVETGIAEWQALLGDTAGYVTLDSHGRIKYGDEKILENDFVFFAEDGQKRLIRTTWPEIRAAIQTTSATRAN